MHLAINGTDLGRQRGGNESFLMGLLQGINQASLPVTTTVLAAPAGLHTLRRSGYQGRITDIGVYRRVPFYLWQQSQLLRGIKPDWYLSTYFLPPGLPCNGAVIVHDVSFCAHPEYFPLPIAMYMRALTRQAIRRAQVVAVDSQFSARETVRYYPESAPKTVITYPGVDNAFLTEIDKQAIAGILERYHLRPGYILAIGNIHPRKNLARLLDAYALLQHRKRDVPRMVWVGIQRWSSAALVERAAQMGVALPGFIDAAHLPAVYQAADVFVYPSLYEGFGLPVLEAMASGTPVVCSNTSSLPEAAGNAALLVNPNDTEELAEAIQTVLDDHEVRKALTIGGYQQARKYCYADTARSLYEALV